jgi:hypothetical protein
MESRPMNIRSTPLFPATKVAALALAAGLLTLGATSADAQWFRWPSFDAAVPAMEVERLLQESGYRLTGPIYRNGSVYVASVLGRDDDRERLIIDARDGRLLQRYAVAPTRRSRDIAGDWSSPRPHVAPRDGWFDSEDDFGSPRPPGDVNGDDGSRHAPRTDEVARTDDSNPYGAPSSSPYVILAPPAATHDPALEKPKTKPQVRHKKPELAPVAQPATPAATPGAPVDAKATPAAPAGVAPNPAAPAHPETAGDDAAAAPRVADTKTAAPAPEVVPAAPAAPPPKAKPAPNDVPVAPLE